MRRKRGGSEGTIRGTSGGRGWQRWELVGISLDPSKVQTQSSYVPPSPRPQSVHEEDEPAAAATTTNVARIERANQSNTIDLTAHTRGPKKGVSRDPNRLDRDPPEVFPLENTAARAAPCMCGEREITRKEDTVVVVPGTR